VAIANAQASDADFAGALETSSSIGQDSKRAEAILSIISAQAGRRDFSGAAQAAAKLSYQPASYGHALLTIASGQTEAEQKPQALGTLGKALESASGITTCGLGSPLICRTELMTEIAMAQFHAGDAVAAEKTINLVQQSMAQAPQDERFLVVAQLAMAEQQLGHADRAKELLAGTPGTDFAPVPSGLQAVGEAAQTGDIKAMKGAAESISNPEQRSFAQFALANVYVEKGDAKGALDTLRSLKPLSRRAEFASELAKGLASKGKFSEADEALEVGMSAAEVEENETTMQELVAAGVQVRALAGDADGARTKAELIKEPEKHAEAVRNAAKALALKEKDDEVLKWSAAESSALIRANLLLGLADGIASQKPEDAKKAE
jgi:tetratricopeptide (TPR) repeat protein